MYSASFQTLSAVSPPFPRSFPLRVSTVSSTVSTLYTLILIYHPFASLPSVIYLQLAAYRSLVSLFPSFFFFSPSLSFPFYERNIPYPARSLPLVRAPSPRESPCFYLFTIATNNGYHTSPWDWRERDEAALGFRWMWYFRFAADSFAISFPSFVFSSSLSLFFLVILFISDPSFLSFFYFWFFVWEELVDEFDCETNKIIVWIIITKNNKIWDM